MKQQKADLLLHPIRMRVIQALATHPYQTGRTLATILIPKSKKE
ncbi:hypothetical protein [Bacillus sp. FJAT-45037]|nr:hypothetical protein [Bacillus sp. FJAT-45037]